MALSLSVYIPQDRQIALARHEVLPDQMQGAILFADISGFTALTAQLAHHLGVRQGAEALTYHLNRVYDQLILAVERFGGSVISFAGDAITCWFRDDDGWRAVACAHEMQNQMTLLGVVRLPDETTLQLALKIAISVGSVRRFLVGDPQIQQLDILAGETLERSAEGNALATQGEILLDEQSVTALGSRIETGEIRSARSPSGTVSFRPVIALHSDLPHYEWPLTLPFPLPPEVARPWILRPLLDRMQGRSDFFLAELRPTLSLFLKFRGLTYDSDPQAGAKLDQYIRWVQHTLARYEGVLLDMSLGDKGNHLFLSFGALTAHDDDLARAVASALALRHPPPELNYISDSAIGMSGSMMYVGTYGGRMRQTFSSLGNGTNLAARLMSAATDGQILLDQHLIDGLDQHYHYRILPPLILKGRADPLPIVSVIGPRLPATQRPISRFPMQLVGRKPELAFLQRQLQESHTQGGRVVFIAGDAGVGKSHLIAETIEQALADGLQTALGTCASTIQGIPYAPWRQILRTLLGLEEAIEGRGDADDLVRLTAWIAQGDPRWRVRLPLLGDLLGLSIPENPTTIGFEPKLRQNALAALVAEILQAISRHQPLLLVIENANWIDEASAELTLAISRILAALPICLVIVQRRGVVGAYTSLFEKIAALGQSQHLEITDLPRTDIATLIENRLQAPPSPVLRSLIQNESQGNPFFAEALLEMLAEGGYLTRWSDGRWFLNQETFQKLQSANCLTLVDGEWVLAGEASPLAVTLGLPNTVQGLLLARLDRLPAAAQLMLKVASVIGLYFSRHLVAQVHPQQPNIAAVQDELDFLHQQDFLCLEDAQQGLYAFKHTMTREVVLGSLLFAQRQELHRTIRAVLERYTPDDVTTLAYHSFSGEEWEPALRYQMAAGEQAQRRSAFHEAIMYFGNSLRCTNHLPPELGGESLLTIYLGLGELSTTVGDYENGLRYLQHALERASATGDLPRAATTYRWLAKYYELRGDYPSALTAIANGLTALAHQETPDAIEMRLTAALIHTRQGNYEEALVQCQESILAAKAINALSAQARGYNVLGIVSRTHGNRTSSLECAKQALALYTEAGNIHGQALALNAIATDYYELGQWSQATEFYQQAQQMFAQTGAIYQRAMVENNLGVLAAKQGRLVESLSLLQTAQAGVQQIGSSHWVQGMIAMNLGGTFVRRSEPALALEQFAISIRHFEYAASRDFLSEVYRGMAEASLLNQAFESAHTYIQQALSVARELTMRSEEGKAMRVLGEITVAQGLFEEAEEHLSESLAILEEVKDEYEMGRTHLSLARTYQGRKRTTVARSHLRHCISIFEQMEALLDLEQAHQMQAELLLRT